MFPKGIKHRPGKRSRTKEEDRWMFSIVEYGCVACRADGQEPRPTVPHHILRGGVRMGHLFTIPLCDSGHHQGGQPLGLISIHPYKAQFVARYGSELELLAKLKVELGYFDQASYGEAA